MPPRSVLPRHRPPRSVPPRSVPPRSEFSRIDNLIRLHGKTDPNRVFESCQTYRELLRCNVAYLQGRLTRTPYHGGPVADETIPLLKDLVEVNTRGFMSISGQPSECETTVPTAGPWKGRYVESQQKSYIEGYLPRKLLPAFLTYVISFPGVKYDVYDSKSRRITASNHHGVDLTRGRASPTVAGLARARWDTDTSFPDPVKLAARGMAPDDRDPLYGNVFWHILVRECVLVEFCIDTYCKGSVEQLLLAFLRMTVPGNSPRRN